MSPEPSTPAESRAAPAWQAKPLFRRPLNRRERRVALARARHEAALARAERRERARP